MDIKKIGIIETELLIKYIKDNFEKRLATKLNLVRVSAPLFVTHSSGLNDNLNSIEEPVSFSTSFINDKIEIVQSLAKWKRYALGKYDFPVHKGIYTDMNAIRKDEQVDSIHSIYVDQWDWEKVIDKEERTIGTLKKTVEEIYSVIVSMARSLKIKYRIDYDLPDNIAFISTKELEQKYPSFNPKQRENAYLYENKAAFIYQIGWPLANGKAHDGRAADYDDWNLNGDILLWFSPLNMALEISSMGIRVDENSLVEQLKAKDETDKLNNDYCKMIINKKLPYTIGGGIGQSRLCMYFLKKKHIGEVQVSVWPSEMVDLLTRDKINLL